ncbi:MAG: amino acid adenylation domain-containing protein [Gemmatimonadota bacterium]
MAAKVRGLETLVAVLADHGPDLWVLQSSLASVLGGIGFAAYSAANHVLDAIAVERARIPGRRWLSVNWDAWNFDGFDRGAGRGMPGGLGLSPAEGSAVFERLLRSRADGQVAVSTADLQARRLHAERPRQEDGTPDGTETATPARTHARPELAARYEEPRSEVERGIVDVWERILGIAPIGLRDDFFELGGHSLLATQLVSRIRDTFHVELPLADMFADPTPAGLAALIERAHADGEGPAEDAIVPVDRGGDLPLSFAQQRMWFLDQLDPGSPLYNNSAAVRIRGDLSASVLEACLNAIVGRHEALRTAFEDRDGTPVQTILPELSLQVDVVDLEGLDEASRDLELRRRAHEDATRPFVLSSPPLLRVTLLRLSREDHVALVTMHHIVSDGWSVQVLMAEIASLYPPFAAVGSVELDPLPVQYADYAVWQRKWMEGPARERQLAVWRDRLRELPEPVRLPVDRPRPSVQGFRGGTRRLRIPRDLTTGVRALARRSDATPYMVLAAAFDALLHRYTRQDEILVGTPVANRNRAEIESLIGFFVNTVVLRADCSGDPPFSELLARVREDALEAFANQDLPFEMLVEAVQPERDLSRTPLFQVMFAFQKDAASGRAPEGMAIEPVLVDTGTAKFDLTLSLEEGTDEVSGWLNYNSDLFDASTVERIASHFHEILASAVADPECRLAELSVLTPEEERRLLAWGRPGELEPDAEIRAPILRILEIARSDPKRIAVVAGAERSEYGSLAAHAAAIGRQLDAADVRPGGVVAVGLRRSTRALEAMLGVMWSGRTYLPIDPALPVERIRFLLRDACVEAVLADPEAAADWVEPTGIAVLDPVASGPGDEVPDASRPFDPDGAAYIIYTSGSTGLPKGIRVANRELALHVSDVVRHFQLSPRDRVLQFASLGFDQSIEQILPTLAIGATLVMREEDVWTAEQLHRTVVQERLSVVNLPPAYLHLWAEEWAEASGWDVPGSLRLVIAGGEELRPETVRLWARTPAAGIRLLNAYGPTEATITATTHEVRIEEDATRGRVPIGRPFGGRAAYVVDGRGALAPIGVPGELVLGGDRLARGYVGRDDLTGAAFIPDPFSGRPGDRLYRTGDRARVLPGGEIEFLGRLDDQVKIRGYRIEPGEVEAVLAGHPGVRDAVVSTAGDIDARRRLVAFVVPTDPGADGPAEPLRDWLAKRLPAWMVPSEFVTLPEIPRTSSGKVDRSRLRSPDAGRPAVPRDYTAPRTPVESELVRIWAEVLGVERIGIHDDFFDLGGHSLLGTRVISRVRRAYPVDIPLRRLFEAPTVAGLATLIAESLAEQTPGQEMEDLLDELERLSEEEARSLLASDPPENR